MKTPRSCVVGHRRSDAQSVNNHSGAFAADFDDANDANYRLLLTDGSPGL